MINHKEVKEEEKNKKKEDDLFVFFLWNENDDAKNGITVDFN